jgi:hypothetical protein
MGVIVATIQGGLIGRLSKRGRREEADRHRRRVVHARLRADPGGLARAAALRRRVLLIAIGQGLCYPSLTSLVSKARRRRARQSPRAGHVGRLAGAFPRADPVRLSLRPRGARPGAFYGGAVLMLVALLIALRMVPSN